jgi:type IV secretion system protein VirB2
MGFWVSFSHSWVTNRSPKRTSFMPFLLQQRPAFPHPARKAATRKLSGIGLPWLQCAAAGFAILAGTPPAYAAGSGMPWEAPLQKILDSIEGPVAKMVAVVIIIGTGLSLAFGDMSGGFRRLVQVVFGLSIAFAATSFFLSFFSFAGGAVIE